MRSFVLAVLASAVVFSPALAQAQYGRSVQTQRATYANRQGVSPVKYVGNVNSSESHYVEANVYASSGHGCGCSSCQSGCREPILGNLLDNAVDLFISLAPCPRPCRGCAVPAHCCTYPPTSCDRSTHRTPFFNALFPCHKLGCGTGSGCQSCAQPACTTKPSCTSCATGAHHGYELHAPPKPEVDTKANPFGDDPPAPLYQGAAKPKGTGQTPATVKRTSAQQGWYKTTNRAPITSAPRQGPPQVFVADEAAPLRAQR
jgi:hypothetical protein